MDKKTLEQAQKLVEKIAEKKKSVELLQRYEGLPPGNAYLQVQSRELNGLNVTSEDFNVTKLIKELHQKEKKKLAALEREFGNL